MMTTVSNDMNDHPTGDLAEMMLMTDLMKLEGGIWKNKAERDVLVRSALESVAILERVGNFSRGDEALAEISTRLKALI